MIEVHSKFGRQQPFLVIGFMTESGSRGSKTRFRCGPSPVVVVVVVEEVVVVVVGHLTLEDFHLEHLGHCCSTAVAHRRWKP